MRPTGKWLGQLSLGTIFHRAAKRGEVHPSNPYLTVWPSGLRRWLQAPVRKGVGSNPTAVICASLSTSTAQLLPRSERRAKPLSDSLAEWSKALA